MSRRVDIAVVVGTGVPAELRAAGQQICWVGLLDGEQSGDIFQRRSDAEAWRSGQLPPAARHKSGLTA